MKLLLISHGNLSYEMFNLIKMIYGKTEDVNYITLPYGADLNDYKKSIIDQIESNCETLVLADLFGGSPFMITTQIYGEEKFKNKMEVVTGMNLPMVLEVVSQLQNKTLKELKDLAVQIGKNGIIDFSEKIK